MKPKWKVGDYVVTDRELETPRFLVITSVKQRIGCTEYGRSYFIYNNELYDEDLSDPTPEELELYFR